MQIEKVEYPFVCTKAAKQVELVSQFIFNLTLIFFFKNLLYIDVFDRWIITTLQRKPVESWDAI